MKKLLKFNQYELFDKGNITEAISDMIKNGYSDFMIYENGIKYGLTEKEIDSIKETFTFRGLPSEKEHQSGYDMTESTTLEDAGFVFNDAKGLWVCDINKDTISTVKKDSASLLWSYRLIKKVTTNGWNSTKQLKSSFSYPTLDSCLAHIKRKLIDEKLIEENHSLVKKNFNLN